MIDTSNHFLWGSWGKNGSIPVRPISLRPFEISFTNLSLSSPNTPFKFTLNFALLSPSVNLEKYRTFCYLVRSNSAVGRRVNVWKGYIHNTRIKKKCK